MHKTKTHLTAALVLGVIRSVYGQGAGAPGTPEAAPETPEASEQIFDAFKNGTISFNTRFRYEHADQDTRKASDLFSVRPRLGFTTAPLWGLQGMIEYESTHLVGSDNNYNTANNNPDTIDRTNIADPETYDLNQAWLSYTSHGVSAKAGRQRIVLDGHRWVGDVGWRQNMQTYDAAGVTGKYEDFQASYNYVWQVNRIFGHEHPAGQYKSESHLMNASYVGCPYGKLVGYTYLLDLSTSPADSSATFGASFDGSFPIDEDWKLNYRAEFAWQTDYGDNPTDYAAPYYNFELGASHKPFSAGVGYEVLGSDNDFGVRTPLATLHKFNGWADEFLTTPGAGLQDFYVQGGVTLPGEVPVKVVYHKFWTDDGTDDLGWEVDAVASKKLTKFLTVLAKFAWFDGDNGRLDNAKFWLQADLNF